MKLKQYQIDRILGLRKLYKMGVEAIADKTGYSKNTVRKYLRLNGYLHYHYPSDLHTGPPSLVPPSQTRSYAPQEEIDDLMQRGGRLIKKLDETNVSLDKAKEQIQTLTSELNTEKEQSSTQIMQLKNDLEKKDEREQNLTTENKRLTEITIEQAAVIESSKLEKEDLKKTVKEQKDEKIKMIQDHQGELEEQKTKNEAKKNHEILEIKKEFLVILEGRNTALATVENNYDLLTKAHKITTEENRHLENENARLQRKLDTSKIYTLGAGAVGVGAGIGLGWLIWGRNKQKPLLIKPLNETQTPCTCYPNLNKNCRPMSYTKHQQWCDWK